MLKSDIAELRKRYTKETYTFDYLCGCYVNSEKNKVCAFSGGFTSLPEEDFLKYLDIAKKSLSGTIGNNIMEYEFPNTEEASGGKQSFLMSLRDAPKDDALLDALYDDIIENYDYAEGYLILVFHDTYDIIAKGSDGESQGESDEVYQYLLISICPVGFDKPALRYNSENQSVESKKRELVVGMPVTSILFPAFTERCADIHSAAVYNKNPKEPHPELVAGMLGCEPEMTIEEKREEFYSIIRSNFEDEEQAEKAVLSATKDIHDVMVSSMEKNRRGDELLGKDIEHMLSDNDRFPDEVKKNIAEAYDNMGEGLSAEVLANEPMLKKNKDAVSVLELEDTVADLMRRLDISDDRNTDTVSIKVPRDMGSYVKIDEIDGEPMVLIPAEDVKVIVNGKSIK